MVDSLAQLSIGAVVPLAAAAVHHLQTVLRAQAGARLALYDAHRWHALGELTVADGSLQLRLLGAPSQLPAVPALTLAVVAPRPERASWLVEKAAELGVTCIRWLITQRAQPHSRFVRDQRLQRVVQAAAQQAGVGQLLQLHPPLPLAAYLALPRASSCGWVVATIGGLSLGQLLAAWQERGRGPAGASTPMACWEAVIGPEGGLTDDEQQQLAEAGALPLSLAPAILRVETAAICAAALGLIACPPPTSPSLLHC